LYVIIKNTGEIKMEKERIEKLVSNLNEMAYNDYHINLGSERKAKAAEKEDKIFLRIDCYTANGRYKGSYKSGYIKDDCYIVGRCDDINAETMEWLK